MNRFHTTAIFALGAVFAASGALAQQGTSGQQPPTRTPAPGTQAPGTQTPGTQAPRSMSSEEAQRDAREREDMGFLENAAQGSFAEVEASKLALEKSESQDVKDFAQKMIDDHQKMLDRITALAKAKGQEPPDGPSIMQKTEITALKALSGGAFDAMYVNRIGVAAHESTVEMYEEANQETEDPEVKALIGELLPTLREHLEMAQALNEKQEKE